MSLPVSRRLALALGVAALPIAAVALPSSASADDGATTTVYVADQVCGKPAAGHASCFASKLVAKQVARGSAAAKAAPVRSDAGKGPAGGFTPGQVAKAYAVDASTPATEQVVAIVDAFHSPKVLANLNAFNARYHLPKEKGSTFRVINQDGGTTLPTGTNKGWAGETDLDVQAVRGLCRTCKIVLVEAKTDGIGRLGSAVDGAAAYRWRKGDGSTLPVAAVSNSYGGPESDPGFASIAPHYDHPGVAILAATADDGWFDFDWIKTNHPEYASGATVVPASLPTVVGVGGTTLKVDPSTGARTTEAVWNRNGDEGQSNYLGATGSGCSEVFDAQPWQSAAAGYDTLGCTPGKRSEVDVAALADPFTGYDVYSEGRWSTFGGTSLSSPLAAALWGLAGGPSGVDYPARTLYESFAAGRGLYDVTLGGNGFCGRDSSSSCESQFGDPNTFGYGPVDCQFAWDRYVDGHYVDHDVNEGRYQCNARAGLDGPSGVGAPTGLSAFQPS